LADVEREGIAVLPADFLTPGQLAGMQRGFASRLGRLRWNDLDGYEKNDRYRHMLNDLLTLDQAFVDVALHPVIKETARRYIGPNAGLVEAKGWQSLRTRRAFHGWHGDAWYDQTRMDGIPRELKLGIYLTDVKSGAFKYIKGTHGQKAPRTYKAWEIPDAPPERISEHLGPAGTAFLF